MKSCLHFLHFFVTLFILISTSSLAFPSPSLGEGLGRGYSKIFLKTSSGTSLTLFLLLSLSSCFSSLLFSIFFSSIKSFNLFIFSGLAARSREGVTSFILFLRESSEIGSAIGWLARVLFSISFNASFSLCFSFVFKKFLTLYNSPDLFFKPFPFIGRGFVK